MGSHRLNPAACVLLRSGSRDPRPQLRGKGEFAAAVRIAHCRLATHANRTVLVQRSVADRGVLRGVFVSRLLQLGLCSVARLVGCRGVVPSILRGGASLPGMEWRPPHGNIRSALLAGGGDLRFSLASNRTPCSCRSRRWNDGMAGTARTLGNKRCGWK